MSVRIFSIRLEGTRDLSPPPLLTSKKDGYMVNSCQIGREAKLTAYSI